MQVIATDVLDTKEKMVSMAQEQLKKPGFAIDPYFYRSHVTYCLLYTSPSPRDRQKSRMPSSA